MANYMIQSKGLSLQYWAEAINCANYIVNRMPTKVLQGITPKEKQKALQPKSEKCIFVGYSEGVKGH